MKILYTKQFSKDLDGIVNNIKLKNRLLQLFEQKKQLDSLAELTIELEGLFQDERFSKI